MKFLYAAYVATWLVHLAYLGMLTRGFARLRQEIRDLKKQGWE
jgi:CcmD family protein